MSHGTGGVRGVVILMVVGGWYMWRFEFRV